MWFGNYAQAFGRNETKCLIQNCLLTHYLYLNSFTVSVQDDTIPKKVLLPTYYKNASKSQCDDNIDH